MSSHGPRPQRGTAAPRQEKVETKQTWQQRPFLVLGTLFKAGEAAAGAAHEEEAAGRTTGMVMVETCFEEGEGGTHGTTGRPGPARTSGPALIDLWSVQPQQAWRRRLEPLARTTSALVQAFLS